MEHRTVSLGAIKAFALLVCAIVASGCQTVKVPDLESTLVPSNHRNWRPDMAVLSTAQFEGDVVNVQNIRNCSYLSNDVFVVDHYNKRFNLNDLRTMDFIVVPFKAAPSLAHTMLSFGFVNDEYLAVSAEVRLEHGESYSPVAGAMRQFEIMYVVGDERDLIGLRTQHRDDDVYVYRVRATPEQVRELFVDVLNRVNKLSNKPEFYDTFTNNCTTNIVRHVNQLSPGRIPTDLRVLLPGLSDRLAYEQGLLETSGTFQEARRSAYVSERARRFAEHVDFSKMIRR